jgi:ACS family tartrate transporter-like MFS transporter
MSGERVFAKCAWRLIPFMILLYLVNYIDRANVGFAALTMNKDLGFSPSVFGLGAGIFFIGYSLFQVPANVILERIGARLWVFCILATWGAISAATALVQGQTSFYVLRFLLGVAEAGFAPGMIYYLSIWFPRSYRARFTGAFYIAVPLAFIVGGPLSGSILGMDGVMGLHGWQWLFLIEGAPAVLLAFAVLRMLPDSPAEAAFLSADEKAFIAARLVAETSPNEQRDLWAALRDPRVIAMGLVYFGISSGAYGVQLWLPQIVQAMGYSNFATGFVSALPFVASIAGLILWGRSSDLKGERIWHVALPAILAASSFVIAALAPSDLVVLIALTLAIVGIRSVQGPYWSLLSSFLSGPAAAGGIGLASTIGTGLGGFLGPTIIGVLKESSGGYESGMVALAVGQTLAAVIVLALGRAMAPRATLTQPKAGAI